MYSLETDLNPADEERYLAALLVTVTTRSLRDEALRLVDPECFYSTPYRALWLGARRLVDAGKPIDRRRLVAAAIDADPLPPVQGRDGRGGWENTLRHVIDQLSQTVPTPADFPAAVETVTRSGAMRRLIEAADRIKQFAYTAEEPSDALSAAADEIAKLGRADTATESRALGDVLIEFEKQQIAPEAVHAIPTPWWDVNGILGGGLQRGRLYVVGARPGDGKALDVSTLLPTPTGWTTMGQVQVGDQLLGPDGKATTVTWATPFQYNRPCLEVEFSDGSLIVADAEHEWLTDTDRSRKGRELARIRTTRAIACTLRFGKDKRANHSIPVTQPLVGSGNVPIPPYTLGAWLGDGHSNSGVLTLNRADAPEIEQNITAEGVAHHRVPSGERENCVVVRLDGLVASLHASMLVKDKHIPSAYLRAPLTDRLALLEGLMDTDGHISPVGQCELTLTCKKLAFDAVELMLSLGVQAHIAESEAKLDGRVIGPRWRIQFRCPFNPFRLERKRARWCEPGPRSTRRYITDVREVESRPVRCVEVDNESHLYLAGETMIPTHNSLSTGNMAQHAAANGFPTTMFSMEMPDLEVAGRLVSDGAEVDMGEINRRDMSSVSWDRFREYADRAREYPLWIVDRPDLTVNRVKAICRQHKRTTGLDVVVVDYLQLLQPSKSVARQEQVAEITRGLKILSRELNCAVIVPSQLNRRSLDRDRPTLADLRESGAIEQDADVVILLSRQQFEGGDMVGQYTGVITVDVAKNRQGRTGDVQMTFRGNYSRIE